MYLRGREMRILSVVSESRLANWERKRLATKLIVSTLSGATTVGYETRKYKFRRAQFSTTWWIATAVAIGWAVTIWQGS